MLESQKINEFIPDLMKYTHKDYLNSKYMTQLQNGIAKEFGMIAYYIEDIYKQFFINTATWGLSVYEKELGLQSNPSLSYEERRSTVLAKLRGTGVATKEMIKSIVESFTDGIVTIIEHNKDYYLEIDIESKKGFPYGLDSLYLAIDEIKPAHLGVKYKLTSLTDSKMYLGSCLTSGESVAVYPWTLKEIDSKAKLNIATANNIDVEIMTLYPRKEE